MTAMESTENLSASDSKVGAPTSGLDASNSVANPASIGALSEARNQPVVGVLALQGDFPTHRTRLEESGMAVLELRNADQLDLNHLDAIVLPGGESTTMLNLLQREALEEPLKRALQGALSMGMPVLATCAGVILIAKQVEGPAQRSLNLLDIDVRRNAYGRQLSSGVFPLRASEEQTAELAEVGNVPPLHGSFIRAPRIERVGSGLQVALWRDDDPVLVRKGSLWAATFHPEMDAAHPVTELFVRAVTAFSTHRK